MISKVCNKDNHEREPASFFRPFREGLRHERSLISADEGTLCPRPSAHSVLLLKMSNPLVSVAAFAQENAVGILVGLVLATLLYAIIGWLSQSSQAQAAPATPRRQPKAAAAPATPAAPAETPKGRGRPRSVSTATPAGKKAAGSNEVWGRYYGGDKLWTALVFLVFVLSPPFVIYVYISCAAHDCQITKPALLLLQGESFATVIWFVPRASP